MERSNIIKPRKNSVGIGYTNRTEKKLRLHNLLHNSSKRLDLSLQKLIKLSKEKHHPPARNNFRKGSKFFDDETRIKQRMAKRKKTTMKKFQNKHSIVSEYQTNHLPSYYKNSLRNLEQDNRVELFFKGYNFPKNKIFFVKVFLCDGTVTKLGKIETGVWGRGQVEKALEMNFLFNRRQRIWIGLFDLKNNPYGSLEFELGQLIGNVQNFLLIDLNLIKEEKNQNGKISGFEKKKAKSANFIESQPRLKIFFERKSLKIEGKYDFLDLLESGLKLSVITCIDFTASNIHTYNQVSLHQVHKDCLNEYQSAIASLCSVLVNYDEDKLISVFGFGAEPKYSNFDHLITMEERRFTAFQIVQKKQKKKLFRKIKSHLAKKKSIKKPANKDWLMDIVKNSKLKEDMKVSHFFPLTGDWEQNAGLGVEGVFGIYNSVIENDILRFSGPTLFTPMLQEVTKFTKEISQEDPKNYSILVIITDGVIHDLDETIEELIKASVYPLSVIIVGVGDEDFETMNILDSDFYALKDKNGEVCQRDIVQFVDYSYYNNNNVNFEMLAENVLKEIPDQVCGYYNFLSNFDKGFSVDECFDLEKRMTVQTNVIEDEEFEFPVRSKSIKSAYLGINELVEYEFMNKVSKDNAPQSQKPISSKISYKSQKSNFSKYAQEVVKNPKSGNKSPFMGKKKNFFKGDEEFMTFENLMETEFLGIKDSKKRGKGVIDHKVPGFEKQNVNLEKCEIETKEAEERPKIKRMRSFAVNGMIKKLNKKYGSFDY